MHTNKWVIQYNRSTAELRGALCELTSSKHQNWKQYFCVSISWNAGKYTLWTGTTIQLSDPSYPHRVTLYPVNMPP